MGMADNFLAALILAGGRSSRMGRDKALIPVAGVPLLRRVVEAAGSCSQQVYVLTPWPERYQAVGASYNLLMETNPGQGPMVALATGLSQIDCLWLLLLACDLPQLQPDILRGWKEQLTVVPPSHLAMIPRHGSRWEPLCGFYRHQALESLQEFMATGERSLQRWLDQVPVTPISVVTVESQMLLNCNTPEDLRAIASEGTSADL
ncbi:molybdopterin-guanine dinucleotide biosynthesis protein A [Arthrospira platensis C1]|nr:molybdopterin-guanine dinucleotide biosynthesis protein A [Arthrospira platensis C1]